MSYTRLLESVNGTIGNHLAVDLLGVGMIPATGVIHTLKA